MLELSPDDYFFDGRSDYQPQGKFIDSRGRVFYPYFANSDLIQAVNLAIALEKPLLLEGNPGCGKTELAKAISYEYGERHLKDEKGKRLINPQDKHPRQWPLYIWNVKSNSQAQDGLYRFDAIARLRDAQMMGTNPEQLEQYLPGEFNRLREWLQDRKRYLSFGPLGDAIRPKAQDSSEQWQKNLRPIVLIDEIDKADIDFANDLLQELEKFEFTIPEIEDIVDPPEHKPIVIITSNREKLLPEAFLRRCVYYFLPFPERSCLKKIIEQRHGKNTLDEQSDIYQEVVLPAIERFEDIHAFLDRRPGSRAPGTSEFLDFLQVLISIADKKSLTEARAAVLDFAKKAPLQGLLIKNQADQIAYLQQAGEDIGEENNE